MPYTSSIATTAMPWTALRPAMVTRPETAAAIPPPKVPASRSTSFDISYSAHEVDGNPLGSWNPNGSSTPTATTTVVTTTTATAITTEADAEIAQVEHNATATTTTTLRLSRLSRGCERKCRDTTQTQGGHAVGTDGADAIGDQHGSDGDALDERTTDISRVTRELSLDGHCDTPLRIFAADAALGRFKVTNRGVRKHVETTSTCPWHTSLE